MPALLDTAGHRLLDSEEASLRRGAPLSVQKLSSLEDLDAFAEEWDLLVRQSNGGPFQSFAWNRAWFSRFQDSYDEIAVFVFLRGATPLVIVPLYRRGSALRLAGDTLGDQQDLIAGAVEQVDMALRTILAWARNHHCYLELHHLLEDSWVEQMLARNPNGWADYLHSHSLDPLTFFEVPETPEDLYGPLPQTERDTLRRAFRRIQRDYPELQFRCLTGAAANGDLMRDVLNLAHTEHGKVTGIPLDSRSRAALVDLAEAKDPGLRIATLQADTSGEILAAELGMVGAGHFRSLVQVSRGGLQKYRPSDWLLLQLVDWLQRKDGVRSMGFPAGEDRPFLWHSTHQVQAGTFCLFPLGPLNLARWAGIHASRGTKRMSRELFQRAGIYRPLI